MIHVPFVPTTGTEPTSFEVGNVQCSKLSSPQHLSTLFLVIVLLGNLLKKMCKLDASVLQYFSAVQ